MTFQYNSAGQVIGTTRNLADDPSLRAKLAAEEKGLLDALKTHPQDRQDILHELRLLYVCDELDFDKAAKLLPLLTNPEEIYNLKYDLAVAPNFSTEIRNAKLTLLLKEYPDRKEDIKLNMR